MGRLTDDMTRLVGEIQTAHGERSRLVQELNRFARELQREGAQRRTGFRTAHAGMVRRQRQALRGFVSELTSTIGGLRRGFAGDVAGARKAWAGTVAATMPRRAPRGAKWFGGDA